MLSIIREALVIIQFFLRSENVKWPSQASLRILIILAGHVKRFASGYSHGMTIAFSDGIIEVPSRPTNVSDYVCGGITQTKIDLNAMVESCASSPPISMIRTSSKRYASLLWASGTQGLHRSGTGPLLAIHQRYAARGRL